MMTEKPKPKRITVTVEEELHARLKSKAAINRTTIAEVVRALVREWLSKDL